MSRPSFMRSARAQLELAFPAHPADALAAINGTRPWPGPALVWVQIEGERIRFRDDRRPYHRRDGTSRG